jgi:hypothetical protein
MFRDCLKGHLSLSVLVITKFSFAINIKSLQPITSLFHVEFGSLFSMCYLCEIFHDKIYICFVFIINFICNQMKIFLNRPIRNKNCLWWPCLLTDGN